MNHMRFVVAKGKNKMDEMLLKLIEMIEKASPAVWDIVNRQVYSDAFEKFVWAMVLLVFGLIFFKLATLAHKNAEGSEKFEWEVATTFFYLLGLLSSLAFLSFSVYVIKMLYNPQFYAIQYLINSVK